MSHSWSTDISGAYTRKFASRTSAKRRSINTTQFWYLKLNSSCRVCLIRPTTLRSTINCKVQYILLYCIQTNLSLDSRWVFHSQPCTDMMSRGWMIHVLLRRTRLSTLLALFACLAGRFSMYFQPSATFQHGFLERDPAKNQARQSPHRKDDRGSHG